MRRRPIAWEITDLGFRMRLSPRVSSVLDAHVGRMTDNLLAPRALRIGDVDHWAIHPGGPKIVDTVAVRLGLSDGAVTASSEVLRTHGSCSSATVLLVLDELQWNHDVRPREHVVAMAFGPGLTLFAALLRAT